MLEHSHLAIELYNFKFGEAPSSEDRVRGAIHALAGQNPAPRSKWHKSLGTRKTSRTATGLSPHHDSPF